MKDTTITALFRPWTLAVLLIMLALTQTFVSHYSMTMSFDLIAFLDLSVFYIIPVLLWVGLFAIIRSVLPSIYSLGPLPLIYLITLGLVIVPIHRAFSLTLDFGFRFAFGSIDVIDSSLLIAIYPYFLSSLPENFLIYLLFMAFTLIFDRQPNVDDQIRVKSTEGYQTVDTDELEAIFSDRNYVILQLKGKQIKCRMTSRNAEKLFSKYGLIRIHRSVMIRPDKLVGVKYMGDQCYQLTTMSGMVYSSSARYKWQVEKLIARNSSLFS